jgi:hypothetical protein
MRVAAVLAIATLLLPAGLSAQVLPLPMPGHRPHPAAPQPMPPEPASIARELSYTRMHFSFETYPQISLVQSSLANGGGTTWAALGAGSRVEYRMSRLMSATMDLTSSVIGGPMNLVTAELGTRFGRARTERRWEPFADVRVGYVAAFSREVGSYMDDPVGYPTPHGSYGSRYSSGWGGVAGAGMEYGISSTLSLTSELLATHSRMSSHDALATTAQPDYSLTSMRLVLGLRYNPVRMVTH